MAGHWPTAARLRRASPSCAKAWRRRKPWACCSTRPAFSAFWPRLYIGIKNSGEALKLLDEALARTDRLEERWFEADLHRLKGEALLACSPERASRGRSLLPPSSGSRAEQSARLWELRAATSLARLWRDQGKPRRGPRACSRRSTAGSPRASIPPTSRTPRRCSTSSVNFRSWQSSAPSEPGLSGRVRKVLQKRWRSGVMVCG